MVAPFTSSESTLTAADLSDQVRLTCDRLLFLGRVVERIAFEGTTSADFAKEGRRVVDNARIGAELAMDDLRSAFVEALTGTMSPGYANSTDLAAALRYRIEANDEAARPSCIVLSQTPDAALIADAHARGAAIVALEGKVLLVEAAA